jgi:hypothetical protein
MLSPFGGPVRGWSPIVIWIMQRDWDALPYTEMNWQGKRALPEGRASVVTEGLVPIEAYAPWAIVKDPFCLRRRGGVRTRSDRSARSDGKVLTT